MTIQVIKKAKFAATRAFTLVEVMAGSAVLGIMTVGFMGALSSGFAVVRLTQEESRATQILQEKMEIIRLYSWDQINTPGYVPTNFIASFATVNSNNIGVSYTGLVNIAAAPISEAYVDNLRLVTVQLTWSSGNALRHRDVSSFVSKYGLQNYLQ
jgi:prepilin-type N-terminal cleavage/methylation domain-containing protein